MPRLEIAVMLVLSFTGVLLAQDMTPACPTGTNKIKAIKNCPNEGCGQGGDALLNKAKNRTDSPNTDPEIIQVHDMLDFEEPDDWLTGQDRSSLSGDEGRPLRLMGYLSEVKLEGGETCNCGLPKGVNSDLHLVITEHKNDPEEDSVSAEITPRVRVANHPQWTYANLSKFTGKFVRVTGWLMLDTAHLHHSQLLEGEHPISSLKRATNWEIHPATALEVCSSTVKNCKNGTGWKTIN